MSVVITDSDIIEESVESQLRRFYQKFNPEKAVDGTVELILKTWKGKEHKLFKNLAKKYNCVGFFDQKKNHRNLNTRHIPHATVDGGHSANVIAAVEIQDDSSSSSSSSSSKSSAGGANEAQSNAAAPKSTAAWDTEAVQAVLRSVDPHFKVADHPKGTLRESLTQFYKVYNRFKLDNIPKILLKIGSQKDQIYELFVNLQKMYSRVPAWSHWQWAEARFHRLQARTKLRDLKRGQETLLAKVKASVQMGEEDRAAALRPALEQIHDDLAKQEQLLEKFTEVERLFEKDWPLEFNMHLQGGQKKAHKTTKKKKLSQKSNSAGGAKDATPAAEASHYEILNQTKATLQSKIDIANEAGEREIVNALFASQRELQKEMARLRQENMVHRPPPPLFGDDLSALRSSHTELRFGFMYFPLSIVQRAMQRHIVNLCGGVEAILKGKPWPSYQVVKREMHEVFGEATFEYHKKMVQNILQTKKLDQAILDEHNRSKPNSPTAATGAAVEVSSDAVAAVEESSSVPEATAEVVSEEVDASATAAKLATVSLSEGEPRTTPLSPTKKPAKSSAPVSAEKAASGTSGVSTAGLTVDGEFSTESKTALQKFLNSQLSFVNAAAAATGSKPSKKIKESGNFTGKTVMALQRFLVAFRRSLCDRGEADTGPDDPLHLEVDGKFAKPTIKVLKWFLNRNWNLAKYGKGEPLDNKKKTLTRGAIKSLQTFLNNSNLFDPLSVPVEGDDDDDDEDDEELS